MARSAATVIENNFSKGLITEATVLTYPEHSVVETFDCDFNVLGGVSRRQGFDYEYGYVLSTISKAGSAITQYHWKNVNGDGLISFCVVQIGNTLYFYSSSDGSTSLSGSLSASTINLSSYQVAGAPEPRLAECQFSDGLGKLYVAHPYCSNLYITYNGTTFTATSYSLSIRDLEGVEDGQSITNRPATLTTNDLHRYNLYNQGWTSTYVNTFQTATAVYPNNADVWWIYKDASGTFNPAGTQANNTRGNAAAPKGHFILDLFTGSRDTASGLSGINATPSGAVRPSTTAFFAGRAWYSGINAAGFFSKIYFSQIITRDSQVGNCYQSSDPTNEDLFDLLPDDGGVISIPEAGAIYKMFVMQNNLLVFAFRGVWLITGSQGLGFQANNYSVSKLASVRTASGSTFVDINGIPMWWNSEGIWTVVSTDQGGLQVQPVSYNSIQTFYDDIPNENKLTARGVYNPSTRLVQWLYRDASAATTDEKYTFDSVLNYNVLTQAFFPWTISTGPTVHGIVVIDGVGGINIEETVIDNAGETVVDDAGDTVVGFELTNQSVTPHTKFLCSNAGQFTWSENNNAAFSDWDTPGYNQNYSSYLITGYRLNGQGQKNFQSNYVWLYNNGTGECYIQGIWDFAIENSTGRYTVKQLAVFDDDSYSDNFRKLKMRGQGKSLQFKIFSKDAVDFNLVGWSAFQTANSLG